MSLRNRIGRLTHAIGAGDGDDLRTVVLVPIPAGTPVGPPERQGDRLFLPYPEAGPMPPLPKPVRYKLVAGIDPFDLV